MAEVIVHPVIKVNIEEEICSPLCMFLSADGDARIGDCLLFDQGLRPKGRTEDGYVISWRICDQCYNTYINSGESGV